MRKIDTTDERRTAESLLEIKREDPRSHIPPHNSEAPSAAII